MKKSIFKEGRKYTFSDYFDLPNPVEDIAAELGYSYSLEIINLPKLNQHSIDSISNLKANYYKVLPKISLNSEAAKREFLIAPILFELAKATDVKISVEYPIDINDKLSGSLDYLIRSKQDLIVIQAKKGDIEKGFKQLAAELIALDKYEEENSDILYGAVTIGEMWIFSTLSRQEKKIRRDINSCTMPEDVEEIFRTLAGIIEQTL